tara:strand:- start:361 stop:804 length:444 start_codon:yes stop_codon:yes gene_type:complete
VLEEIQQANKAFATIKSALQNGREFYDVSESCATYFNCKSIIARRSKKKGRKTELQNFMELEKLRKQEEWIREWMIYAGRPNLYDDWLKFQSQCKKVRAAEERAKKQSDEAIANQVMKWFKWMGGATATLFSILVAVMDFLEVAKGD